MVEQDLISREALMAELRRQYCYECHYYDGTRCRSCYAGDVIDMVEDAPAIDAVPVVHGRWVKEPDRANHWHCSECGRVEGWAHYTMEYCPTCGAKMDKEGG